MPQQKMRHPDNRPRAKVDAAIQSLERRLLLDASSDGGVFGPDHAPTFTATSDSLMDLKHGPFAKGGGALAGIYREYKKFVQAGGKPTDFKTKSSLGKAIQFQGASVGVTVRGRGSLQDLTEQLQSLAAKVISSSNQYSVAEALVPVWNLSSLMAKSSVASVMPLFKPVHGAAGIAVNQADRSQNADALRTAFGLDGSGVKVAAISDSVDQFNGGLATSVFTGDLPDDVQVIADDPFGDGTDEGRAMLELIHDIAPKSALAFASGELGQLGMATNIISLADAGANIIVDDLQLPTSPFFQESVIGQAIGTATHQYGISYFSSAANNYNNGFAQKAHWVQDPNGRTLLDFDPSDGVDTKMEMVFLAPQFFNLQWDEPYNGVSGAATSDIDIRVYDHASGILLATGIDDNIATGIPMETFFNGGPDVDIEIELFDHVEGAPLPTRWKIDAPQPTIVQETEYAGDRSSILGHNGAPDAISVGAVPYFRSPQVQNSHVADNESFSANGPVMYLFNTNGTRRDKPLILQKPDFSAIDGSNTSFFGDDDGQDKDKLRNFYGTSAAAPNAAAVAALLKQLVPSATPEEIKRSLLESAKSHPLNGQKPGTWHSKAGFGLIDGLMAAHFLAPQHPIVQVQNLIPDNFVRSPKTLTIMFSEPVSGFDLSDVSLTRGKDGLNLLSGPKGEVKLTTVDHQTYFLKNINSLADKTGTYTLSVTGGSSSGIVDADGSSALGNSRTFRVTGKPTSVAAVPVSPTEIDLMWNDNTTNERAFKIYRANDPNFHTNLQTFTAPKNKTVFKDTGLQSGFEYFYKVKALTSNSTPDPTSSVANAVTLTRGEVLVDNTNTRSVKIDGSWRRASSGSGFIGRDFLMAQTGGGSVSYTPKLPASGDYFVYVRTVKGTGGGPVTVNVNGKSMSVPATSTKKTGGGAGWRLLGRFDLEKGTGSTITINSSGAGGVADAVRFQLADPKLALTQSRSRSDGAVAMAFSRSAVSTDDSNKDPLDL